MSLYLNQKKVYLIKNELQRAKAQAIKTKTGKLIENALHLIAQYEKEYADTLKKKREPKSQVIGQTRNSKQPDNAHITSIRCKKCGKIEHINHIERMFRVVCDCHAWLWDAGELIEENAEALKVEPI